VCYIALNFTEVQQVVDLVHNRLVVPVVVVVVNKVQVDVVEVIVGVVPVVVEEEDFKHYLVVNHLMVIHVIDVVYKVTIFNTALLIPTLPMIIVQGHETILRLALVILFVYSFPLIPHHDRLLCDL
jgi:hypothetical protein